jgi:hypothetical protein
VSTNKAMASLRSRWHAMRRRCDNPWATHYSDYGGRGIFYCDGLRNLGDYVRIVTALDPEILGKLERGERLSLDRFDNDDGYTCGNCSECVYFARVGNLRWATPSEQSSNRRRPRMVSREERAKRALDAGIDARTVALTYRLPLSRVNELSGASQ